jgi:hypothetical protein
VLADSARWVDYRVAQTSVSRSQAFAHIRDMVGFWGNESRSTANQVRVLGMNPVPNVWKPEPAGETRHGYFRRGRWYPYNGWR